MLLSVNKKIKKGELKLYRFAGKKIYKPCTSNEAIWQGGLQFEIELYTGLDVIDIYDNATLNSLGS